MTAERCGGVTGETMKAEAIPPDVLTGIVRDAIEIRLDLKSLGAVLKTEKRDRKRLLAMLRSVG